MAHKEIRIHPTQKPVALYAWLLNKFAKPGDRIFDPMMGSQSSRIAAYKMGFDYVGCELDKEYFDKGCERFNRECMGEIKTKVEINEKGKQVTKKVCEFGINLDERIADGYYFAKSLQLLQYIFDNPSLLEDPANDKITIQ